jgi:hypothetical protein
MQDVLTPPETAVFLFLRKVELPGVQLSGVLGGDWVGVGGSATYLIAKRSGTERPFASEWRRRLLRTQKRTLYFKN